MKWPKFSKGMFIFGCLIILLFLMFFQTDQSLRVAYAVEQYSRFTLADLTNNRILASDWPLGDVITVTVDDPSTPISPDYTGTDTVHAAWWNPNLLVAEFVMGEITLKPGDIVTTTDNSATFSFTVLDVQITGINPDTDIVDGIAPAGMTVEVSIINKVTVREVTAGVDGTWSADFSIAGLGEQVYDIKGGTIIYVNVHTNDHSATERNRAVMVPYMEINIDDGACAAHDWPLGAQMTFTSTGSEGLLYTGQFTNHPFYGNWKTAGCVESIYANNSRKLHEGDMVTITDGFTPVTCTISDMKITHIDMVAGTISGSATPGNLVEIYGAPDSTTCGRRFVLVDGAGNWTVDFQHPGVDPAGNPINETCDLTPGSNGQAYDRNNAGYEGYNMGNATWINWSVPLITAIYAPQFPVQLGQNIDATVEFSNVGYNDPETVRWEWGDNTSTIAPAAMPSVTTSHTYTNAGVYTITATITNSWGASDSATFQYVVVYDPSIGFVTGGGWIMSPAGAYKADPTLVDKATFGFVSKYHKGQNYPDGNAEFQFSAGDLNFQSTIYQWLIVNQNYTNAQFKGYGTINGAGNFGFMIWANDGNPDTFRIKIWVGDDENNIVYDNNVNKAIGGGSIVIHK